MCVEMCASVRVLQCVRVSVGMYESVLEMVASVCVGKCASECENVCECVWK